MIAFVLLLVVLALLAQRSLSRGTRQRLSVTLHPEAPVAEPDRVFHLVLTVQNSSRRFVPFLRMSLYLPGEIQPMDLHHWRKDPDGRGGTLAHSAWLHPGQQLTLRIPLQIHHRGRYVFHRLHLYAGDFLGIQEEAWQLERFNEIVIPPTEAPELPLSPAMGSFLGNVSARRFILEDPILTTGFRPYTGREPMKSISWTQSARGQGLMVKSYDYSTEPRVSVLLNNAQPRSADPEELEDCYRLARTVCRLLEDRRIPYDLCTNAIPAGGWADANHPTVPQGLGAQHLERVLELLGRATHGAQCSAQTFALRCADSGTTCGRILITPTAGMPPESALTRLREVSGNNLLLLTPSVLQEGGMAP